MSDRRTKARELTKRSDIVGGTDIRRFAVFSNAHVRVATACTAKDAEEALSKHNARAKTPGWMQPVKDVREDGGTWVLHENIDRRC